jgi:hypothetical protein
MYVKGVTVSIMIAAYIADVSSKIAPNVFGLGEVGEFEKQMLNYPQKPN